MSFASSRRSHALIAVLLASSLHHASALAQPTPVSPPAPPAPAVQQHALVLVAMTGDPAFDQHLRTIADELRRRLHTRGFADVAPERVNRELAADPTGIATLRSRLGAAYLVRVDVASRAFAHLALNVIVQTDTLNRTIPLEGTPADLPARVLQTVEPLLPTAPAPAIVRHGDALSGWGAIWQASDPAPAIALDRVVLDDGTSIDCHVVGVQPGSAVLVRTTDGQARALPWRRVRQILPGGSQPTGSWSFAQPGAAPAPLQADWPARGGSRFTFGVQALVAGVFDRIDHVYAIEYPDDQSMQFTGDSLSGGGGGGVGLHLGYLYLAIPTPAEGDTIWGFRAGTGIDLAAIAFGYRSDSYHKLGQYQNGQVLKEAEQTGGETSWTSAPVVLLPLSVGGQVGVGHFEGNVWRGTSLGLEWRPTYSYAKPADLDGISSFNYLGFGGYVDIGSLHANAPSPEANFRLSLAFLPVIDRNPSYLTLGFGAVWY